MASPSPPPFFWQPLARLRQLLPQALHTPPAAVPSHSFLSPSDFSTEWPALAASISSRAILLILKKHYMFLFADGQHSKEEKKNLIALKQRPQTGLDLVQSYLLLTAPACPFIIVICTNAILCPEIVLRHLIL